MATRGHAGLGEVTSERLGHLGGINLAVTDLDGLVAIGLLGLDGRDHVGGHIHQRDGDEEAVLVPHLRHAELATQQSLVATSLRSHNDPSSLTA